MPDNETGTKPVHHLAYLDSVRGIAALVVAVYHYINWTQKDKLVVKLTSFIFNGADAVSFFFVLSGFVLAYKYLVLKKSLDFRKFYINRFFRLWPAFFLTVLVNAIYHDRHSMSFQYVLDLFVYNKHAFWEEAMLIRPVFYKFYNPGWTLMIEFIMSLFVPFIVIMAHKSKRAIWWLAGFFFFACAGMFGQGMFITHFIFGTLIATYYTQISSKAFEETRVFKYRFLVLIAAVILFSARHLEYMFGAPWFYDEVIYKFLGYDVFYFTGIGSFIFLVFIIHSRRAHKLLEHNVLRFIGKISYGIYLTHWVIVSFIFDHWHWFLPYFPNEKLAFCGMLIVCLSLTILLAYMLYNMVELPFIKMSKRWTSKMKPSLVIEP